MTAPSMTTPSPPFWARQFGPKWTFGQIAFDVAFGIVLPIVCLVYDPIVFRSTLTTPMLGQYAIIGYVAIGLGIVSLAAWLVLRRGAALFVGLLVGGALFSLALGVVLIPISLLGLMVMFIGVLGFSPFATAFVYGRNAIRAYRQARPQFVGSPPTVVLPVLGLAILIAGPWTAQAYVHNEVTKAADMVVSGTPEKQAQGVAVLHRFRTFANFDGLVFVYEREQDSQHRERLAAAYLQLTGEDIDMRLARIRD